MKPLEEFLQKLWGRMDSDKLLICPNANCKERGDYLKCYYDKYPDCKLYNEYQRSKR